MMIVPLVMEMDTQKKPVINAMEREKLKVAPYFKNGKATKLC